MKKILQSIMLAVILLTTITTHAQLSAGDIAFIGYNTDASINSNDNFSFITLADIPGNEVIYFTEEGWNNISNGWAGTSESHLTYTAPIFGVSCGTVINVNESSPNTFTVLGGGTVVLSSGSSWSLTGGDQVLAYQAATAEPLTQPTFIAGVHGDDGNGTPLTLDPINFWNTAVSIPLGTARSELPPGLTNGVNCVSLFPAVGTEVDNAKYTGTLTGTTAVIRASINDYTKWSIHNSTAFAILPSDYTSAIICAAPCTEPDVPTVSSLPGSNCPGATVTLSIAGDLNDATAWHIYTGSCGGTEIGTTASTSFDVSPSISTTYYVRAEGGCVAPGACGSITINPLDNTDPIITVCASTPANISANGSCQGTAPNLTGMVTATDNCTGSPVITQSPAAGATLGLGTTTITLTATDGSGNTATCTVNQTVIDATDPVIVVCASTPANISANGSCQGTAPNLTGMVTATDNCTGSPVITQSPAAGATLGLGTTTITLTATDGSGNTATCTVNQTVIDATDPVIVVCASTPANISANGSCQGTAPNLTGMVTATDNCTGSPVITQSPAAGATLGLGTTTITLTATDGSGNTATCTVNQTVIDATDPVIVVCASTPANISANGNCQGTAPNLTGMVTATDNCTGSPVITQSPAAGATLGLGTTTITLTATDGSGNMATCTVNQTVVDATDPVIVVCASTPANISANGSCQGTAPNLTGMVTATDNCTATPVITQSPAAGATLGLGTTTITLTATDGSGNTATCTVNQTVVDATDPVIVVCASTPANIPANGSCQGTAPDLTGMVTATDNCTGSPVITQSPAAGATLGLGTTTITLTATDGSGNTATCTVNQTVVDDVDPVIVVCAPTPPNIQADENCEGSMPYIIGSVVATDNCSGNPVITQSPAAGTVLSVGATTVTVTATDEVGNTTTCTVVQTVLDGIAPTITCLANQSETAVSSCTFALPDYTTEAVVADNCTANPTVTQSPAVGTPLSIGDHTITLTADDGNGNTTNCDFTLTVSSYVTGIQTLTECAGFSITVNDHTYSATGIYVDVLVGAAANGCDSTLTTDLTVLPALTGLVANTICNDDSVVVNGTTYNAANPTGTEVFTNVGPYNCDSTVTINLNVLPEMTGTHTSTVCFGGSIEVNGTIYDADNLSGTEVFTGIGDFGCDSVVTVSLTVLDAVDNTTTLEGQTIASNQDGATYQWVDCTNGNIEIPRAINQDYSAELNGEYAVMVTVGNCSVLSDCVSILTVGVDDVTLLDEVLVYPNPNRGLVNIDLGQLKDVTVSVFNSTGKMIYTEESINANKHQFQLNEIAGAYFVRVTSNDENKIYKLIIL